MKVLDLQCVQGHSFEGWFGSHDDYEDQRQRGLIACPLCGDSQVSRLPSAPRLNLGATESAAAAPSAATPADADPSGHTPAPPPTASPPAAWPVALQAAWMHAVRQVIAKTEDVGERFAQEARAIHHGDAPARGIRGQASAEETAALLDEGIGVLPLPVPDALKEPLQ